MSEASEVSFGLEVSKAVIGKFLMSIIGFVGTIVFARVLGPVAFGGYYLIWSVVQVTNLPVGGVSVAAKKRFSESESDRSVVIGGMILISFVVSFIAIFSVFLIRGRFDAYTGIENSILLFSILFISFIIFSPFQTLLSGTGRIGLVIWIDLVRSVLTTPLQIVLVLLGWGAMGMGLGLTVATVLTVPITYYYLDINPSIPGRDTIDSLWSYAKYSIPSTTVGRVYSKFDILLLGYLLTPAAVGYYEVAMKLTIPAILLPNVAGNGLMARVSNLRSKKESIHSDVTNTLSFSSIFAIPIFFGALTLSEPLITNIYGSEYQGATTILIGLSLFRFFESQSDPLGQVLNGIDKPQINMKLGIIALFVNAIIGVPLTLWIGATGVVIGTILAECIKYIGSIYYLRRSNPCISFINSTIRKQFFAGVVMASTVLLLRRVVSLSSPLKLIAIISIGAIIYSSVLIVTSEKIRFTIRDLVDSSGVKSILYN